jgi:hypothetical protein
MNDNKIKLKSISELFGKNFYIPGYQRGYRWEEQQIVDLLNDISDFQTKVQKKKVDLGEFYCLQPLIVSYRENDEKWEVVDGQQRLTSIFIILSFLQTKGDYNIPHELFSIEYETREKENYSSKEFLKNISSTSEINKANIDFYRMSDAYLIVKEWFEENKPTIGKFVDVLISHEPDENDFDEANNIRFIWYPLEVESGDNEKLNVVFAKYNQGKIDLTNADLIKAIFYLSDDTTDNKKHQIKIGYEWDNIETSLRQNDFGRFINPSKSYLNHIEFIFDLVASKYESYTQLAIKKDDRLRSFYIFNELISKKIIIFDDTKYLTTREFLWDEIKTYHRTFVEWYSSTDENNKFTYFHLIGFLLQTGKEDNSIEKIKKLAESKSKSEFVDELKIKIGNYFDKVDYNNIGYDDKKDKAKMILLLFNVITTMNGGNNKFSFDRISNWSLEHIHAQQSKELTNNNDKRQLLEEQKNDAFICKHKDISNEIEALIEMSEIDQSRFEVLQQNIFALSSDASFTIHSIKNLALLTPSDNSSLNNGPFHKKRDKIRELDENGSFIPICTKNVFLKYYTKNVEQNVKWDKRDMESYLIEMKKVLKDYITENI